MTTETPVKATKFDQSLKIILLKDFTGAILIFGKKAPFFWFSIPDGFGKTDFEKNIANK